MPERLPYSPIQDSNKRLRVDCETPWVGSNGDESDKVGTATRASECVRLYIARCVQLTLVEC